MALENQGFKLLKQGAEGKLYFGEYLGRPTVVKERFTKGYRHPDLDAMLTKERMKAEARAIVRCKSVGIKTPTLYLVDFERHQIYMENFTNSITVKEFIINMTEKQTNAKANEENVMSATHNSSLNKLTQKIGVILATMHKNNIIHGDLTTSNMLLSGYTDHETNEVNYDNAEIILIDFGLSHTDSSAEDKGVDLYVLERALTSTHSICADLFCGILDSYKQSHKKNSCKEVLEKFEEVRARGRKRTMVG